MACRIGMATNVAGRVRQLQDAGLVPARAPHRTLRSGLTYSEANEAEANARQACGAHCQAQGGGGDVSGRVWSVYRIDW